MEVEVEVERGVEGREGREGGQEKQREADRETARNGQRNREREKKRKAERGRETEQPAEAASHHEARIQRPASSMSGVGAMNAHNISCANAGCCSSSSSSAVPVLFLVLGMHHWSNFAIVKHKKKE